MADLKITSVKIRLIDDGGILLGTASVTLFDCFVVHDLKLISTDKGLMVAMPSKKSKDGKYRDVAHPITRKARSAIERAVLSAYDALIQMDTATQVAVSSVH